MAVAFKDRLDSFGQWAFPGLDGRQVVTLYLGVPLAIGAILGWYRAGYAAEYPLAVSLFEWTTNFFALWIAFDLGSRLISFLLKPWTPPLWLILVLGGIAGVAVSRPIRSVLRDVSGSFAPDVRPEIAFPAGLVWEEYVFAYASVVAVPILIWIVVNYVYAEGLGVPRYGVLSDKSEAGRRLRQFGEQQEGELRVESMPVATPEFVKKLTAGPDAEIRALQAEDHYLRVYTDKKSELIRYRFSDAVGEVQHLAGLQVHRSFWINTDSIQGIRRAGRSYEIILGDGLEVPVSRSYRYAIKEAGLLSKFPNTAASGSMAP